MPLSCTKCRSTNLTLLKDRKGKGRRYLCNNCGHVNHASFGFLRNQDNLTAASAIRSALTLLFIVLVISGLVAGLIFFPYFVGIALGICSGVYFVFRLINYIAIKLDLPFARNYKSNNWESDFNPALELMATPLAVIAGYMLVSGLDFIFVQSYEIKYFTLSGFVLVAATIAGFLGVMWIMSSWGDIKILGFQFTVWNVLKLLFKLTSSLLALIACLGLVALTCFMAYQPFRQTNTVCMEYRGLSGNQKPLSSKVKVYKDEKIFLYEGKEVSVYDTRLDYKNIPVGATVCFDQPIGSSELYNDRLP